MNTDRIDFISSYCDRWCDRCAYTSRCSAFAVDLAIGMCGDFREALELAVGTPAPERDTVPAPPEWASDIENIATTAEERAEFSREEENRNARVNGTSIMKRAWACTRLSHLWLSTQYQHILAGADCMLKEALQIVSHDAAFVTAKIHRALQGRDQGEPGADPIQNDWNGSAKVALISLERSEAAWLVIAQATGESTPAIVADHMRALQREVADAFPNAWLFVRPGFDEPGHAHLDK